MTIQRAGIVKLAGPVRQCPDVVLVACMSIRVQIPIMMCEGCAHVPDAPWNLRVPVAR